jgi:heavy metal translocating P-type ATPase
VSVGCAHCGLPVRGARRATGPRFCCTGCALAWRLGREAGSGGADLLLARVVVSAFLAMGVMVASLALYGDAFSARDGGAGEEALRGLVRAGALLLTLPVLHLIGTPLLLSVARGGGWRSADGLVLFGTGAAFLLSAWNTCTGRGEVYFETASGVLVLVGLGRWLDVRAKERARGHVRELAGAAVPRACRVEGGLERELEAAELAVGDVVRVRPGEPLAVDGVVLAGAAFVETAALTGEQRPRRVGPGDAVLSGSTPLDGALDVRATSVGQGRVAREVERMLARALDRGGRFVRLADGLAGALLPVVALLALGAGVVRGRAGGLEAGWMTGLSVVLISCPCALGIATPLVFWRALGLAWERGVLVRGADVLERIARARRVWFDKTGTLTSRALELREVRTLGSVDERGALRLAAALEQASEHPIGAELRRAYGARGLPPVVGARVLPGVGVAGDVDGVPHRLRAAEGAERAAGDADTTVVLERDGRALALFRLAAALDPGAADALDALRARGLELRVLTGDDHGPAEALAQRLRVPVHARLLPADKLARVAAAGAGTVYVGDGLNDAAALAAADVGVAVGDGSPRSLELADVLLLRAGLDSLAPLVDLARQAVRTARVSLAWAFGYNALGLGLAVSGRLTPLAAAAAMVLSSAAVVLNSTRVGSVQRRARALDVDRVVQHVERREDAHDLPVMLDG